MTYRCTAVDYLSRAGALLNGSEEQMLYAAWELRCCIERTLFEYLVLMNQPELPKSMEKLYSAKDLKRVILNLAPDFLDKLRFLSVYMETSVGVGPALPDLDLLSGLYGKLNDYLHAPKEPGEAVENMSWWNRLRQLLSEAADALGRIHSGPVAYIQLNDSGWSLFEKWKQGSLGDDELKSIFQEGRSSRSVRKYIGHTLRPG